MATVLDTPAIKEAFRSLLNANNITTSSVRDLSSGLETRVKIVMSTNPRLEKMELDKVPGVAIWIDGKSIKLVDTAINQNNGKRETEISLKIAGFVNNSSIIAITNNESDSDAERLLENIELILRSAPTLSGVVTWQYPTDVEYYNISLGHDTCYKVGIMNVLAKVYY